MSSGRGRLLYAIRCLSSRHASLSLKAYEILALDSHIRRVSTTHSHKPVLCFITPSMVHRSQAQAGIDRENSNGTPSARKRVKVEELPAPDQALDDAVQPQPAPQPSGPQHGELWLRDGNVIIIAEELSFKLHASTLERHSSVFRELLEDPQPGGDLTEIVQGCRVLRMSDWGPDLAQLLKIVYDGGAV